jgi:hypothetical protein
VGGDVWFGGDTQGDFLAQAGLGFQPEHDSSQKQPAGASQEHSVLTISSFSISFLSASINFTKLPQLSV